MSLYRLPYYLYPNNITLRSSRKRVCVRVCVCVQVHVRVHAHVRVRVRVRVRVCACVCCVRVRTGQQRCVRRPSGMATVSLSVTSTVTRAQQQLNAHERFDLSTSGTSAGHSRCKLCTLETPPGAQEPAGVPMIAIAIAIRSPNAWRRPVRLSLQTPSPVSAHVRPRGYVQ